MEENNYYYENPGPDMNTSQTNIPTPPPSNGLAIGSLVLGISSLLMICCGGSFIAGSLGIILALLSRGKSKMNQNAKTGLILSSIGLSISLAVYLVTFAALIFTGEFQNIVEDYMYFYENADEFDDFDNYEIDEDYFNDLLQNYQDGGEL